MSHPLTVRGSASLAARQQRQEREAGAELRTGAPVERIALAAGRATGVVLEGGEAIEARAVLSNADPRRTLLSLVGAGALDAACVRELSSLDFRSPSLKINLALDRLPVFAGTSGNGAAPEHRGTIHVGARTLDELDA